MEYASLENKYVLKRIHKSSDEDYVKALNIYTSTTPLDIMTESNQITKWLDKGDSKKPFELLIFCLYLDEEVVGFAQITYVKSTQIAILDYISLKNPYRVNFVFLAFLSMMQNYINSNSIQVSYYIAEISNKDNGMSIDKESAFYKRVICLENFGKVDCKYYNMPLGLDNYESDFESLMYLKSNDTLNYITKETFLKIVESICFDYYLVWYSEFLSVDEQEEYRNRLNTIYEKIKKKAGNNTKIKITYASCPLFKNLPKDTIYGMIPTQDKKQKIKTPIYFISVVLIPLILAFLYQFIFSFVGIEFSSISTFTSGLLCTFFTYFVSRKYKK